MRILPLLCFLVFLSCSNSKEKVQKTDDQIAAVQETRVKNLFVRNANDWHTNGDAHWIISDNFITGLSGLGYLVTNESYGDFVLEAEFYPDPVVNSGIFIRCPKNEFSATSCYEINIWDNHKNQDFRTGSIVTHGKPLAHVNSINKWSHYKIKAQNNRIEVWINDIKTADLTDDKSTKGYIGFQVGPEGKIKFRNIKIEKL